MEDNVIVRSAQPEDVPGLAALKEAWAQLSHPVSESERREFAEDLAAWMRSQGQALLCHVAEADGQLVGMAWLVLFERVPDIHDRTRLTGDIQSVYVLPQHRQRGIGRALVRSLIDAADERGVPRVTVSANAAAAAMYSAEGFGTARYLLERSHR
ncbi:GNAT family N-acetyltransferase [Arthrobacter sp. CDRTa11]|uniref:GNAT family N-acetyltransferase n=1 Tax=Arthrobacter sp. CDRTa11 TaxID=2651199 RepID=UPI002265ACB2|nr:GNAT family N-acetyltransferase [Arthrobacter sp. CDRTa11]